MMFSYLDPTEQGITRCKIYTGYGDHVRCLDRQRDRRWLLNNAHYGYTKCGAYSVNVKYIKSETEFDYLRICSERNLATEGFYMCNSASMIY